jgi:hypothetical protein
MDFRYLTESKNEFNNLLNNILIPHLYNGIFGMLEYSIQTNNMLEEKKKKIKNVQNPGTINIFKMCLNDISGINNYEIENEYKRIKEKSNCAEWFDNLIKASFKSYVLFLTWDPRTSNSKYNDNEMYEKISIKDFIHKCYIETCDYFKENPEIFLKRGPKKEIYDIIKNCIEIAIKKTIPYNEIIQEYLKINFTVDAEDKTQNKKEIANIKNMVYRILSQNKYGARPTGKAVISEDSDKQYNYENQNNSEEGKKEIEKFIFEEINNSVPAETSQNFANVEEDKEIFRPYSATNSKHSSLKSKTQDSDTSDDFAVPEYIKKSLHSTQSKQSTDKDKKEVQYEEIDDSSNMNKFQEGGNLETTTQIMTRSEAKRKELDLVLNDTLSETSKTSKTSKTSRTSRTSKNNKSQSHLESPMPIKRNQAERIYDDVTPPITNMVGGKRKIQIIKNKSNVIHDKVNGINNYFTKLINN